MCHYDEDMNVVGQFEISMERGMSPITRWDLLHDNVYYNAINKTIVLCRSLGIDHKHVCMYVCICHLWHMCTLLFIFKLQPPMLVCITLVIFFIGSEPLFCNFFSTNIQLSLLLVGNHLANNVHVSVTHVIGPCFRFKLNTSPSLYMNMLVLNFHAQTCQKLWQSSVATSYTRHICF